jgi:hypothetical protein
MATNISFLIVDIEVKKDGKCQQNWKAKHEGERKPRARAPAVCLGILPISAVAHRRSDLYKTIT